MPRFLPLLCLLPCLAQAAGEGAWQASNIGITLNHRGVAASSRPLSPSQPVQAKASTLMKLFPMTRCKPASTRWTTA